MIGGVALVEVAVGRLDGQPRIALHEPVAGNEGDVGKALGKTLVEVVVRGSAPVLEQSGVAELEGTGADAQYDTAPRILSAQPRR